MHQSFSILYFVILNSRMMWKLFSFFTSTVATKSLWKVKKKASTVNHFFCLTMTFMKCYLFLGQSESSHFFNLQNVGKNEGDNILGTSLLLSPTSGACICANGNQSFFYDLFCTLNQLYQVLQRSPLTRRRTQTRWRKVTVEVDGSGPHTPPATQRFIKPALLPETHG